jgi:hypothetical protein
LWVLKKSNRSWELAVVLGVLGLQLAGCQPSTDTVEQDTKQALQSKLDSDPDLKPFHLKVSSLDVVHEDGTRYRGIATVMMGGANYSVTLRILDDGHKVLYETDQGAFAFISQHSISADKSGWSRSQLSEFTAGCVESVVDKTRHDYEARAAQYGDSGADFPERELRESFGGLCSCISKEISKRWDFDEFQLDQDGHTQTVLAEVTSSGRCPVQGILARVLGKQGNQSTARRPASAQSAPVQIQQKIAEEEALNDQCRDGGPDDSNTTAVCDRRDSLVSQLKVSGWCWGHEPQIEAERQWEPCRAAVP